MLRSLFVPPVSNAGKSAFMNPVHHSIIWRTLILGLASLTLTMASASLLAQERLRITGTGSGTGGMTLLAEAFMLANPGVQVDVLPVLGSSGGIRALIDGKIDLAVTNRQPNDKERSMAPLKSFTYARTPLVIAVHKDLGLTSITSDELAALYGEGAPSFPMADGRVRYCAFPMPPIRVPFGRSARRWPPQLMLRQAVVACSTAPPTVIRQTCWNIHPVLSDPVHSLSSKVKNVPWSDYRSMVWIPLWIIWPTVSGSCIPLEP